MLGLELSAETPVGELSVAQKQLVEIAKAVSNRVRILVLDEPTAAITDRETRLLFDIIRDLKRRGMGIVYISHRLPELFEIADRCTVMRDGAFVGEVGMNEANEANLIRMMAGREIVAGKSRRRTAVRPETVLEVKDLGYRDKLRGINLTLRKGEILGIAGLVGSGRTELARCIVGDCRIGKGEVVFQGRPLAGVVSESVERGIAYLGEDRRDTGLVLCHSVAENIALPNLRRFGRGILNRRRILEACRGYIGRLRIRPDDPRAAARSLSGGNQQKVVIAKWLCFKAHVYIFDEPTRGIDVGAREDIYRIMENMAVEGASILMISSDLAELMKMSDRIAIMNRGRLVAILENDDRLTREEILAHAVTDREREPAGENE
jgi:ribose transport system ATP-binding protein